MIENEIQVRRGYVLSVARAMMAAARTAPKGCGVDRLEIITLSGDELAALAGQMRDYAARSGRGFFVRDADNVEQSEAVVIIGTRLGVFKLDCGYCGFASCDEKLRYEKVPCAFNTGDLGIALGSAAAIAADNRVDSRVMYSVGQAALELDLLGDCAAAYGIVLSCTGKSPYFDRAHTPK